MATRARNTSKIHVTVTVLIALFVGACGGGGGGGSGIPTSGNGGSMAVTIVNPSVPEIETPDASMRLQGTASSNAAIASVSWKSNRGGAGQANGTEDWQTDAIALEIGANKITVTASDYAGNVASAKILVHRENKEPRSVTLNWTAPEQSSNGAPLTDLAGYKIHYGRMSGIYDYEITINNPGILSYVVENLYPGDWYFSMTAFDKDGNESDFSSEVKVTLE
jgi:hypothetical protein